MIIRTFIALLAAGVAASASAQELPAEVAEAYSAYVAAGEARDFEAAKSAAREAWQAAERLGVDAETTAILADNYAQLAGALGEHAAASEAYNAAAELLSRTEQPAEIIAETWILAARSALAAGENRTARRYADTAGDLAEEIEGGDPAVRANLIFSSRAVQSNAHWLDGQVSNAAARAREAMAAAEVANLTENPSFGLMAFILGVQETIRYDYEEAAYRMTQAYAYLPDQRRILTYWVNYARDQLDTEERAALLDRLSDLDMQGAQVPAAPDADVVAGFEAQGEFVDALPERRVPPEYPRGAAVGGFDGVTLLEFTVNERGRVTDIEVIFSLPFSDFGTLAERAMARWRYTPATLDGVPVDRPGVTTLFQFELQD